ncbi:MAG: hypothetical protein ACTSYF_06045 [Promethearchaeota archaeon]
MSFGFDGYIGETLGERTWKIPKERFIQYQRAIGDLRMEYIEEDQPRISVSFLAVVLREVKLKQFRDIPELVKDPLKILHAAQSYKILDHLPKVETEIKAKGEIFDAYVKRNKLYLISKTDLFEKDKKFAEAYSRIVVREGGF